MTTTTATRSERDSLRASARALDSRLTAAVRAEYPDLCGWAVRTPIRHRMIRTGPGPDDWRWGAYRSAGEECAALRRYISSAPAVAGRRISEAYGLGEGGDFLLRHGWAAADCDAPARARVLASLAAVQQ